MPKDFGGKFVDLTTSLGLDEEFAGAISGLNFDERFTGRRGCAIENFLLDPFVEQVDEDKLADDDDFIIDFELRHDEDMMSPEVWVQLRYGPVIAKMEGTISPDEQSDELDTVEVAEVETLPLTSQSGNFEPLCRLTWDQGDYKASRKWKNRKARKPRRFGRTSVRTSGEMSLAH
jgi:hypothetical protein